MPAFDKLSPASGLFFNKREIRLFYLGLYLGDEVSKLVIFRLFNLCCTEPVEVLFLIES